MEKEAIEQLGARQLVTWRAPSEDLARRLPLGVKKVGSVKKAHITHNKN